MLSWVNFVKWHNFLTLQTLFPVCRHTLVPSCMSENTDTIIFLSVSLTSIFLLINVRPLVVSLRPRGKPPSQWHNIGKLYHYLNLPFQLPSPHSLSFIYESWNIAHFFLCLCLCTYHSVFLECTFSARVICSVPSWTNLLFPGWIMDPNPCHMHPQDSMVSTSP